MTKRSFTILLAILATLGSFSNPVPLRAEKYATSFQAAQALHALDKLLEEADTMLALSHAEAGIKGGACRSQWAAYTAGQINKDQFNACFAQAALRYPSLMQRKARTLDFLIFYYRKASERYKATVDQTRNDAPTNKFLKELHPSGWTVINESTNSAEIRRIMDRWVEEARRLRAEEDKKIGTINDLGGKVEILRSGVWRRASEGLELRVLDRIRTDNASFATVTFSDGDVRKGFAPTKLSLGLNTEVELSEFLISFEKGNRRTGVFQMLRGALRSITKSWGNASVFSVRAGTTICGIRGTTVDVIYAPERHEVILKLYDGEVEIRTGGRRTFTLRTGYQVTVTEGVAGPIRPIGQEDPPG